MEQLRNVVFVLITDQLAACFFEAFGRPLVLDHQHRDAVDERHDIAPLGLDAAAPFDREFRGDVECVVLRPIPVDKAEGIAFGIAIDRLGDCGPQHQHVIDILVGRLQPSDSVGGRLQPAQRLVRVLQVERVFPPPMRELVDPHEVFHRDIIEHHIAQTIATQLQCPRLRQRRKAQRHQHLQGGNLGLMLFGHFKGHDQNSGAGK